MALPITITDAGRAEIINAQNTGTGQVTITEIGFGTGQYTPTKTRTALQAEVKRVSSIAGQAVAADTIHVMALDESSAAYNVGEFGLFSDKGTLIAVYSQPAASGWIIQKAGASTLLLATDIILESLNATSITFGDVSFLNPPATTTVQGVVELATPEETQSGTDGSRAVTPAGLKSLTASLLRAGLVQLNDTLTSSSTSQALTAAQGKKLQDEKQPKDDTLTSLAALVTAANKLIYATGLDTFTTTDLTPFARTLLDDLNASAALATLGAAPLDNPTFTGDPKAPTPASTDSDTSIATTAFVRAAMALFGVGAKGSTYLATPSASGGADSTTDWNTITSPGWWHKVLGSANPNHPGGGSLFWYCLVLEYGGTGNCTQVALPYGTGSTPGTLKWRTCYNGTWSVWRELFHTGNFDPALKADLASPAFTGDPKAPTPAADDNDTSIATTAFVRAAMGLFGLGATTAPVLVDLDLDTTPSGLYQVAATATGSPVGQAALVMIERAGSQMVSQRFYSIASDRAFFRRKFGATWGAWQELWHTGNLVKQANAADTAAGALLTVGAFGLGAGAISWSGLDFDTVNATGWYYAANSVNSPSPGFTFVLEHIHMTSTRAQQVAYAIGMNATWTRFKNTTWGPWVQQFDTGNVSTFIQTLFDDPDAATARATLGANNASNLNTGTVSLAQLPTSVRNMGQGDSTQDPNAAIQPVILSNHANTPNSGVYWHITTTFWNLITSSANRGQIAVSYNSPTTQVWSRSCFNNVWTPWVRCDGIEVAPPGKTAHFAMSTPPLGWLKANGAAVSRTAYAALFAAIGTMYGAGDGSTTFNLPDMRGEFVRGWDDGRGVDSGRVFGSAQADELRSHAHTMRGRDGSDTAGAYVGGASTNGSTKTTEVAGGTETRPRNLALLACIKY